MTDLINEGKVCIGYLPEWRRYYITIKKSMAIQGILYCPWCGFKFPKSLREEYFDILENELKIEITPDMEAKKEFPKEFLTDEWWKKRGL
jgi:hypothetical protein